MLGSCIADMHPETLHGCHNRTVSTNLADALEDIAERPVANGKWLLGVHSAIEVEAFQPFADFRYQEAEVSLRGERSRHV